MSPNRKQNRVKLILTQVMIEDIEAGLKDLSIKSIKNQVQRSQGGPEREAEVVTRSLVVNIEVEIDLEVINVAKIKTKY